MLAMAVSGLLRGTNADIPIDTRADLWLSMALGCHPLRQTHKILKNQSLENGVFLQKGKKALAIQLSADVH
jgi:hypothetical protein